MQRWQTRARRWESRAAERRSKRRLGSGLKPSEGSRASPLGNDNETLAVADVLGAIESSGRTKATFTAEHNASSETVA
jgi:hypothetical protein